MADTTLAYKNLTFAEYVQYASPATYLIVTGMFISVLSTMFMLFAAYPLLLKFEKGFIQWLVVVWCSVFAWGFLLIATGSLYYELTCAVDDVKPVLELVQCKGMCERDEWLC